MLKKALYQKNRIWNFWFFGLICFARLFRPSRNTGGLENRNYELRVSFCNSPIYWKKNNNWGFHIEYRSFEHDKFDNILIVVVKWKCSSFYRFCPTLKSFCDYFKNSCAFHKIQIITTKRIVAFLFNNNIVHV